MAHENEPIVSFRLPNDRWLTRLNRMAEDQDRSKANILRRIVIEAIESHETHEKVVKK